MSKEIRVGYLIIGMFLALAIGMMVGAIISYNMETGSNIYRITNDSVMNRALHCVSVTFKNLEIHCMQSNGESRVSINVLEPVTVSVIGGEDEGD